MEYNIYSVGRKEIVASGLSEGETAQWMLDVLINEPSKRACVVVAQQLSGLTRTELTKKTSSEIFAAAEDGMYAAIEEDRFKSLITASQFIFAVGAFEVRLDD